MKNLVQSRRINIVKAQINRVINVKNNILKRGRGVIHPAVRACDFIFNYDNRENYVCHSSEERVFSAMQEGRN